MTVQGVDPPETSAPPPPGDEQRDTNITARDLAEKFARPVKPGTFEPSRHFYPRAQNAQLHPSVGYFMRMDTERILLRYCHLNPRVRVDALRDLLAYQPRCIRWAGCDLFHVTTSAGVRQMIVIETNSSPSGNKSMPVLADEAEQGGYRRLMDNSFMPILEGTHVPGGLAVLYDKNVREASGYAAAMADSSGEPVWLAPFAHDAEDPPARFVEGVLEVRDEAGQWHPMRAAMRYVTQKPWTRIPVATRTLMFNPVLACLAGGRNKAMAAKAYDLYNAELIGTGLEIRVPETINDLHKQEIPLWVRRFGGHAVVKVPYGNAGQGVYTITSERELAEFMATETRYERMIVQSLIGNYTWSSTTRKGHYFHVGTMPDKKGAIYVTDLRMMVVATPSGLQPMAIYSRRARSPLAPVLTSDMSSWDMLGTNLSEKLDAGAWATDTDRLILMDRRDFTTLGLGPDELIEAFIQTCLSVVAIDRMAQALVSSDGSLRMDLFRTICDDDTLLAELVG